MRDPVSDLTNDELRLVEIASRAKSLPQSQREKFLAEQLASSPKDHSLVREMMAGTVEIGRLQDAFDFYEKSLSRLIESPAVTLDSDVAPSTAANLNATTDLGTGSQPAAITFTEFTGPLPDIPDHQLGRILGRGGMGVVVAAFDKRLEVDVAIKLMRPEKSESEPARQRFLQEARSIAQLRHPHIVGVLREGEMSDGTLWFSMELIEGKPLSDLVSQSGMACDEAARITQQIAEAITFAHSKGIFHRDIKPANVLLDKDGQARVVDFGLAKNAHSDLSQTIDGNVIGTPRYMAPEQIDPEFGAIGPSTDIYAVGALLYSLLTGRPPHQHDNPYEQIKAVVEADIQSPGQLRHDIDRDLAAICMKCLHRLPSDRYANAQSLVDDLRRYREDRPVTARAIDPVTRSIRWSRRNPMAVGVIAATFIGALVSLYFATRARQGEQLADDRALALAVEKQTVSEKADELAITNTAMQRQLYGAEIREVDAALKRGRFDFAFEKLTSLIPPADQPDPRGIEWGILWRHCIGPYRMRHAATDYFNDPRNRINFSPDEGKIAQAGTGKSRVWSVPDGKLLYELDDAICPRFTSDGEHLLLARDKEILVCDARTFRQKTQFSVEANVTDLFPSQVRDAVWVCRTIGTKNAPRHDFQLWSIPESGEAKRLAWTPPINGSSRVAAISPDETAIVTTANGLPVTVITATASVIEDESGTDTNKETDLVPHPLQPSTAEIQTIAFNFDTKDLSFSHDGKFLCRAALGYEANILETDTWTEVHKVTGNQKAWQCGKFTPDDKRLILTGYNEQVWVYDTDTWQRTDVHPAGTTVWTGAISPKGRYLAVGGANGLQYQAEGQSDGGRGIRLLSINDEFQPVTPAYDLGEIIEGHRRNDGTENFLATSDGNHYARLTANEQLSIVDVQSGKSRNLPIDTSVIRDWCWFDSGQCLAFLNQNGQLYLVSRDRGRAKLQYQYANAQRLAHDPSRPAELLVLQDGVVHVVDAGGRELHTLDPAIKVKRFVASDGRLFLIGPQQIQCLNRDGKQEWLRTWDGDDVQAACAGPKDTLYVAAGRRLLHLSADETRLCGEVSFQPRDLFTTDSHRRLVVTSYQDLSVVDPVTARVLVNVYRQGDKGANVAGDGSWIMAATTTVVGTNYIARFNKPKPESVLTTLYDLLRAAPKTRGLADALARQLRHMDATPETLDSAASASLALSLQRLTSSDERSGGTRLARITTLPGFVRDAEAIARSREAAKSTVAKVASGVRVEEPKSITQMHQANLVAAATGERQASAETEKQITSRFRRLIEQMSPGEVAPLNFPKDECVLAIDGHRVLSGDRSGLSLLDLATGQQRIVLEVPTRIWALAIDREARWAYVGTGGSFDSKLERVDSSLPLTIERLNLATFKTETIYEGGQGRVRWIDVAPDGSELVFGGNQMQPMRIELKTLTATTIEQRGFSPTVYSKDGQHLWMLDHRKLKQWESESGNLLNSTTLSGTSGGALDLKRAPGNDLIGMLRTPGQIGWIDPASGRVIRSVDYDIGWETQFDVRGGCILAGTEESNLLQLSVDPDVPPLRFSPGLGDIKGVAALPGAQAAYISCEQGTGIIRLGEQGAVPEGMIAKESSLAEQVAELAIRESVLLDHPTTRVHRVAEGRIVCGSKRELMRIDLQTGTQRTIAEFNQEIYCFADCAVPSHVYVGTGGQYQHAEKKVVSESPAQILRVNYLTGETTVMHEAPQGRFRKMFASPDSKYLFVSGEQTGAWRINLDTNVVDEIWSDASRLSLTSGPTADSLYALRDTELAVIDIESLDIRSRVDLPIGDKLTNEMAVHYFPTSKRVAILRAFDDIFIVEPSSGEVVQQFKEPFQYALQMQFHPHCLMVGCRDGGFLQLVEPIPQGPIPQGNATSKEPFWLVRQTFAGKQTRGLAFLPSYQSIYVSGDGGVGLVRWPDPNASTPEFRLLAERLAEKNRTELLRLWDERQNWRTTQDAEEFQRLLAIDQQHPQLPSLPLSRQEIWDTLLPLIGTDDSYSIKVDLSQMQVVLDDYRVVAACGNRLVLFDLLSKRTETVFRTVDDISVISHLDQDDWVYFGTGGRWDKTKPGFVNRETVKLLRYSLRKQEVETLRQWPGGTLKSIVVSDDGRWVMASSDDGECVRFDTQENEFADSIKIGSEVSLCRTAHDQMTFGINFNGRGFRFDLEDGNKKQILNLNDQNAKPLPALSADGRYAVVLLDKDKEIVIVDVTDGRIVRRDEAAVGWESEASWSETTSSFLVVAQGNKILRVRVEPEKPIKTYSFGDRAFRSVTEIDDGAAWIVGGYGGLKIVRP